MPTYRLDLAYDGTGFRGLARQGGQRTIQGEVEAALARTLRAEVATVAAGRTDAGVHARQQVMSFSFDKAIEASKLLNSLTRQLRPEVVPYSLAEVDEGFDARRSAISRTYRYQINNAAIPNPLTRHSEWHIAEPLDVGAMDLGVGAILGEHDFASFCRASSTGGTVRRVLAAEWSRTHQVTLAVRANAFCHQMIRSIVGLSVDIGRGRRRSGDMAVVMTGRDRNHAGQMAPAHGLILWEVTYET